MKNKPAPDPAISAAAAALGRIGGLKEKRLTDRERDRRRESLKKARLKRWPKKK